MKYVKAIHGRVDKETYDMLVAVAGQDKRKLGDVIRLALVWYLAQRSIGDLLNGQRLSDAVLGRLDYYANLWDITREQVVKVMIEQEVKRYDKEMEAYPDLLGRATDENPETHMK